jgi:hypothetical protein
MGRLGQHYPVNQMSGPGAVDEMRSRRRVRVFLGSKELDADDAKPVPVDAHCPLGCVG